MFSIVSTPARPVLVNQVPGVIAHFQCNTNFERIYQSDDEMGQLAAGTAHLLNLGCRLAQAFDNRDLHKVVAYTEDSSLAIFSLEGTDRTSHEQRVFGLKLRLNEDIDGVANKISKVI